MRRIWRWLPTYVGLAFAMGASFAFVKLALDGLTPVGVGIGRIVFGGMTVLVACALTRTRLPPRRIWLRLAVVALISMVIPWTASAIAQTSISSALAGIISSSIPLLTLVAILTFFREEVPSAQRIGGLFLGFAGMLLVIGIWHGAGTGTWVGILTMLAANSLFALSYPYTRRYLTGDGRSPSLPPLSLVAGVFIFAAIEAAPAILVAPLSVAPIHASVLVGILGAGCIGSGLAFVLNYRLIRITDATSASTVLYFAPLVAVLIGMFAFDEEVTWNQPVGGAVILAGAALAQGLFQKRGLNEDAAEESDGNGSSRASARQEPET